MKTINLLESLPTEKKIKEGLISCSWVNAAEIYDLYLASKSDTTRTKTDIFTEIAEKTRQSESTVRHYIYRIDAILK